MTVEVPPQFDARNADFTGAAFGAISRGGDSCF